MNDLAGRAFGNILLIKPSSPGDIIHALPVLHGLRRRYPRSIITWLVASPFANLIEEDPALDAVLPFERRRFGRVGRSLTVTREFLAFLRRIRDRQFDLVIDLQGLFRSGFLSLATGAAVRLGFAAAREMAWIFYTHRLVTDDPESHAADRNYAVARLLGFADLPMDFSIAITEEDRTAAGRLVEQCLGHPRPPDGYAVLVPVTRWETKCWPAERYGLLARRLRERHGLASLLVGGEGDRLKAQLAVEESAGAAHSVCGRTTLRQLAALVSASAVVVTADSTPMHLAAALQRPLVALFGPTSPRRTGPYGRPQDVVRLDLTCSPCYLRRLRQCPHQHACMQRLTVEAVAEAVSARLRRSAKP